MTTNPITAYHTAAPHRSYMKLRKETDGGIVHVFKYRGRNVAEFDENAATWLLCDCGRPCDDTALAIEDACAALGFQCTMKVDAERTYFFMIDRNGNKHSVNRPLGAVVKITERL